MRKNRKNQHIFEKIIHYASFGFKVMLMYRRVLTCFVGIIELAKTASRYLVNRYSLETLRIPQILWRSVREKLDFFWKNKPGFRGQWVTNIPEFYNMLILNDYIEC